MRKMEGIVTGIAAMGIAAFLSVTAMPITASAQVGVSSWAALQSALAVNNNDVKLNGDIIASSTDTYLHVPDGVTCTLDLNGHTINRSLSAREYDGEVICVNGNLTINDSSSGKTGKITGGKNKGIGGGVLVDGGEDTKSAKLILNGGSITDNEAWSGGGVHVTRNGEFTMNNISSSISGNKVEKYGGGVSVIGGQYGDVADQKFKGGKFIMNNGSITSNEAIMGGGVYVDNMSVSKFTMISGSISGNKATDNGGGVLAYGNFEVSGDSSVINNNKVTTTNNVEVLNANNDDDNCIIVIGAITGSIGVNSYEPGIIAKADSGYKSGHLDENDISHFSSDYSQWDLIVTNDKKCALATNLEKATVMVSDDLIYDKTDKSTLTNVNVKAGNTTLRNGTDYEYTIKKGNEDVTEIISSGTYTVKVNSKGGFVTGSISKDFIVGKRPVKVSGIKAKNKDYDGTTSADLDLSDVKFDGLLDGDSLSVTATGTFADAEAGQDKKVNITGLTLTGVDADNYCLAATGQQTTTTSTINRTAISDSPETPSDTPTPSDPTNPSGQTPGKDPATSQDPANPSEQPSTTDPSTPAKEEEKPEKVDKKQKNTSLSKPKAGKKTIKLSWKKVTAKGIKGYEIQCSTDKKFKNDVKIVTIKKTKTTSKTIKKLKSKKKYYVRIRTYKKSGGEKIYSKWSKSKSVKVK